MGYIGHKLVNGIKEYSLYDSKKKTSVLSSHPAHFSPEDTFSKYRIELKREQKLIEK